MPVIFCARAASGAYLLRKHCLIQHSVFTRLRCPLVVDKPQRSFGYACGLSPKNTAHPRKSGALSFNQRFLNICYLPPPPFYDSFFIIVQTKFCIGCILFSCFIFHYIIECFPEGSAHIEKGTTDEFSTPSSRVCTVLSSSTNPQRSFSYACGLSPKSTAHPRKSGALHLISAS